jgi:preprotein translocase subunit SecF
MAFRILRKVPTIDFVGARWWAYAFTGLTALASVISLAVQGLNLGIDFTGGVLMELQADQTIEIGAMRSQLEGLNFREIQLQGSGANGEAALVRLLPAEGTTEQEAVNTIKQALGCSVAVRPLEAGDTSVPAGMPEGTLLRANSPATIDMAALKTKVEQLGVGSVAVASRPGVLNEAYVSITPAQANAQEVSRKISRQLGCPYDFRRQEAVGPKVSGELFRDGIIAAILAVIAIALYVAVRFEWQFGLSAIVATAHDVFTTVGLYSIFQLDFNLTAIAALLTLAGYSVNETVVEFDRIRENRRRHKKMPLPDLINLSVNQTLGRTLVTASTVILSILPLVIFGGPALFNFSASILFGVIIGTYSSIYVSSSLLIYMPGLFTTTDQQSAAAAEREKERQQAAGRPTTR